MISEKDSIIRAIEAKNSFFGRRHNMKMFAWNMTLTFAYVFKRLMDIVLSFIMILLLSPLMIFVLICIRLGSEGPIIFKQVRVGKNGRHFNFYKFRSMYISADDQKKSLMSSNDSKDGVIFKMKHDPRVTPIGRFIRKFSIDELPQLFNVLEGSMSLVGPRPPLPSEVMLYTLEERKKLDIKPGITCIWQVSGRSDIPFKKQVKLDEEYIKNHGILSDIFLLLKTIPAVIFGKGAY